jgi:hypothetical protein
LEETVGKVVWVNHGGQVWNSDEVLEAWNEPALPFVVDVFKGFFFRKTHVA